MMQELLQLPYPEDIYDLDTFELQDIINKINSLLNKKSQDIPQEYLKKAKKIADLASQEIHERQAIEDIGIICEDKEKQFFKQFEQNYVSQLQQNLKEWNNVKEQLIQEELQQSILIQQNDQIQQIGNQQNDQISQKSTKSENQQYQNLQISGQQKSILNKTEQINQNSFSNNLQDNKSRISGISYITDKKPEIKKSKKDSLADFIRETLEKTKIESNKMVIGKSSVGKYIQKSVPRVKKVQEIHSDKDYQKVQSRVKQNLQEIQANKPVNQYYTTGKPSIQKPKKKISQNKNQKEDQIKSEINDLKIEKQFFQETKEKNINNTLEKIEEEIIINTSSIGGNQAIEQLENKYNQIWNNLEIPIADKVEVPKQDLTEQKIENFQSNNDQILEQQIKQQDIAIQVIQKVELEQNQNLQQSIKIQDDKILEIQQIQEVIQEEIQEQIEQEENLYKKNESQRKELKKKQIYRSELIKQKSVNSMKDSFKKSERDEDSNQNQHTNSETELENNQIDDQSEKQVVIIEKQDEKKEKWINNKLQDIYGEQNYMFNTDVQQQKLPKEIQQVNDLNVEIQQSDEELDNNEDLDSPTIIEEKMRLQNMMKIISNPQIRKEMKQKLKEIIEIKRKRRKYKQQVQEQEEQLKNIEEKKKQDALVIEQKVEQKVEKEQEKTKIQQKKVISFEKQQIKKIKKELQDKQIYDYSQFYSSFEEIFTGFYFSDFNVLNNMKELQILFESHIEKMKEQDKGLNKLITPLDVKGNEAYYVNDPKQVVVYGNRVNITIKRFINRQIVQTQRLQQYAFQNSEIVPNTQLFFRVIKTKQEVYDIITRGFLRQNNWDELPSGKNLRTSWNLIWTWSKPNLDMSKLLVWQKVNHFVQNKNLVRKDLLKQNIQKITKQSPHLSKLFDIIPQTYSLPKEYGAFSQAFTSNQKIDGMYNYWIIKPIGKSQGRGISVINDISNVLSTEPLVVQKYIKNPLTINNHKFDLRIYVLVTSFNPLEAFIFKEGFARLTTEEYSLHPDDIKNTQIHLTNFSIQKYFYDPLKMDNAIGGTKISLKILSGKLQEKGIQWEWLWIQIKETIIKSLISCQQDIPYQPNCFEIFGYDILIDQNLKCTLLEINSSPSLARDFILDDLIKQQLIDDTIELLDIPQFDRERLCEVLERRIREQLANNQNYKDTKQMNFDLNYILRGQKIRKYGEIPDQIGDFEMIAPGEIYDKIIKIIKSFKQPVVRQNHMNIPQVDI